MTLINVARRTILSTVAAGAAACAIASTASAAANDVTYTPSVVGNVVTITITNAAESPLACTIGGFARGADPLKDRLEFGYGTPADPAQFVPARGAKSVQMRQKTTADGSGPPTGSTAIPDGDYDIYYVCGSVGTSNSPSEVWGTDPLIVNQPNPHPLPVIRVSVPGASVQPPAAPACGSLCGVSLTNLFPVR